MKAPESHHETASTARAKREGASEMLAVTPGEKQNGDASKQYQNREDLEKAYNEVKKSEARLRKILDTIPKLAWCNLPDGSNEFVNQRWSDYTGLSQEEVKRVGCKVAIHPEDLPKQDRRIANLTPISKSMRFQPCLPKYFQNSFADSLAASSLNTTDLLLLFGSLIRPFSHNRFKTSQSCPFHALVTPCSVNEVR